MTPKSRHSSDRRRWRPAGLTRPAILLLAAFGPAACTLGPDFHSPAKAVAGHYRVASANQTTVASPGHAGHAQHLRAGTAISADWYALFKCQALDSLIATALANNSSIAAGQASLREAADQLEAAGGSNLPNMDVGGDAGRRRGNGAQIGLDNPLFNNVFDLYTGRLSLGYHLDLFGATTREIEAATARVGFEQDVLRGTRLALIDNIVVTTVRYAALHDRLDATKRIIAGERAQLDLLGKQQAAGAIALADVLRARAALADSQATLPPLRHEIAVTRHALAQLVAADPATFKAPDLSLKDLALPADLPVSLPSELVRQRPDILAAEQLLHSASAEVGVATAHLYPDITLSANLGGAANHAGDLLESAARIWDFGGSVAAPVFHGGALRANRKAAVARFEQQYDRYRQTVQAAFTQVADVLDAIDQDADLLKAQDQALAANSASLALMRKQYAAGAVDYLDVLTAEQRRDRALLGYIEAESRRYIDTASLYHALGGGWWNQQDKKGANAGGGKP